jgi:hypothetical protein
MESPKKLRAADISWEAPPSLVQDDNQQHRYFAHQLRVNNNSVPPKELVSTFQNL